MWTMWMNGKNAVEMEISTSEMTSIVEELASEHVTLMYTAPDWEEGGEKVEGWYEGRPAEIVKALRARHEHYFGPQAAKAGEPF